MKPGFLFFLYNSQLLLFFEKAKKHKNPAEWLYSNNVRTPLFMMESLCRLFKQNPKGEPFKEWDKAFKKLEDVLGQIDFYDVFLKEFYQNKKISPAVIGYLEAKKEKSLRKFEKRLKNGDWFGKRSQKFETFINEQKINFTKELIVQLEKNIKSELIWVKQFAASVKYNFTDIELQVHDVRRKLRWISIYGQSLQGIIKLAEDNQQYSWKKKYLTKHIMASPYNKLPIEKNLPYYIEFKKDYFFALSWMIGELGILKDEGLKLELLTKAIRRTENLDKAQALKKAQQQLGIKHSEKIILQKASKMAKEFFVKNKIPDDLIKKHSVK